MLPKFLISALAKPKRMFMCAIVSMAVAACGGGGGSPGAVPGSTPVTPPTPVVTDPTMTMNIVNDSGVEVSTVSGTQTAFVRIKLVDSNGVGAVDSLIKYVNSDPTLIKFLPANGSAKTDATGTAVIAIQPASATAFGALSITASGTSAATGKVATATKVISVTQGAVVIPVVTEPVMTISFVDGAGAPVNSLAGIQTAFVKARLVDANGTPAADSLIRFVASDPALIKFIPDSASAKTDASGTAVITIQPANVNAAGALSVSASGTSAASAKSGTASKVLSVAPAPLVVGPLSFASAPPAKLPAFSTVAINVPITSGGLAASSVPGLSVSSLCLADGTAKIVLGSLANGVQSVTYTNTGCLRGNDTVTAVIGSSSQSISLGVDPANIGTIQFVGSDLAGASIVLRGSGGLGRKESALLTFRVLDQNNSGLAGVDVAFKATTTTGGLNVLPAAGTTDSQGFVTTTVSSGSIPTPVRVVAEASRNGRTISGLSDQLTISTGLPIQRSMSLSADVYNLEGLLTDGVVSNITVRMADQYGNPISDNTAVSFITEGGVVGTSDRGACVTVNGGCSVPLRTQNFRPTNGRVTVLAFVQGIEDFVDLNGDGQYSCANPRDANGAVPVVYRPLIDRCESGGEPFRRGEMGDPLTFGDMGDPFLDTGLHEKILGNERASTLDGLYEPIKGDLPVPFDSATFKPSGNNQWGLNYIRAFAEFTFSGSVPTLIRQVCSGNTCRDWSATDGDPSVLVGMHGAASCTPGKVQQLSYRLFDVNNNPLPATTTVGTTDAEKLTGMTTFPNIVPSTNRLGGTIHSVDIKADPECAAGSISVRTGTPGGVVTVFRFRSGA